MNREQLADAMLMGVKAIGVEESRQHYVAVFDSKNICFACALGSALIGKLNNNFREAEIVFDSKCFSEELGEYDAFAELLDIPASLAIEIEHRHLNGQSIEQIAKWLKGGE